MSVLEVIERIRTKVLVVENTPKIYKCELCQGKGIITRNTDNGFEARKCVCKIRQENRERLERSGLIKLAENHTFENFKISEPFQIGFKTKAMEFLKQDKQKGFFIGGQVGSGKTHICTAIAVSFIDKGLSTIYSEYRTMIINIKACANNSEEYKIVTDRLKTISVLYVDDLFKTKNGEDVMRTDIEHFFNILNYRYNNNLVTIISSEKTITELLDIDEAIGSRISEMCGEFKINISSDKKKNYRLRA